MAIFSKAKQRGYDYNSCANIEGQRLRTQAKLLADIDKPLYKSVIQKYPGCTVLDIGCNEGDCALDRLSGLNVSEYIGLDVSAVAIENAAKKYSDDSTHFVKFDVESKSASRDLYTILQRYGKDHVEVITISMVLLHLVNPEGLIKLVYPFLTNGGTILIKDIDDRDNSANIDEGNLFADSYDIADENRDSGNRNVGWEIPSYLKHCGYSDIKCIMRGLSSKGMSSEQKQALWDTYYGFFIPDCEAECRYTNGSKQALYNLGWCHYFLPQMKEVFMLPNFEFTLGFCVYIASKEA